MRRKGIRFCGWLLTLALFVGMIMPVATAQESEVEPQPAVEGAITALAAVDGCTAPFGTPLANVGLAATVEAQREDQDPVELPLIWTIENYDEFLPGDYTATGTPDLEGTALTNPLELSVTATVTVLPADKEKLQQLVDAAVTELDESVYNVYIRRTYQQALEAARAVLEDDHAAQTAIDQAADGMEKAARSLIIHDDPVEVMTFSKSDGVQTRLLYGTIFYTDWKKADNAPRDMSGSAGNGANRSMALMATVTFTALREGVDAQKAWRKVSFRLRSSWIDSKEQAAEFVEVRPKEVEWIDEHSFNVTVPLSDIKSGKINWADVKELNITADVQDEYHLEKQGDSPDLSMTLENVRIAPYTPRGAGIGDEKPLLTIACLSDLHTQESLLTDNPPHLRGVVTSTLSQIKETEDVDVILIGGDITSNDYLSKSRLESVLNLIPEWTDPITKNVLLVAGNHDYNAGERDGYNSAPYYDLIMKDRVGELPEEDAYYETYKGMDILLAYHYVINGFDFVCLNTSPADMEGSKQNTNYVYTPGVFDWVEQKLAQIGPEKTVFVMGHLPIEGSDSLLKNKGLKEESSQRMMDVFKNYPNVLYLYGHDHGSSDNVYIHTDTLQRVTLHDMDGQIIGRGGDPTDPGFVTSFMGSMRYYSTKLDAGASAKDSNVVQALMVYVYEDQIVLQMKNYGAIPGGEWDLRPVIVKRNRYEAPPVILGDVDGESGVTAADALMALQAATGKIELTDTRATAADVDGVVGISAADALLILQFATGKITAF
ncbi:MAG: metallophosphoesterase [Acutalibacteraceae bacterium]|jgi:predicted MPP superfamily phosphohydrolase